MSRWNDNEGEWPPRWQPPATPWPHVSDVWVPQHRRAVVWCMRTSTASQLIDWGDAGTAAEADALLDDRPCSENCEGRHARIWTEPGRLNVMPGAHDRPVVPSGLAAQLVAAGYRAPATPAPVHVNPYPAELNPPLPRPRRTSVMNDDLRHAQDACRGGCGRP